MAEAGKDYVANMRRLICIALVILNLGNFALAAHFGVTNWPALISALILAGVACIP